MRGKYTVGVNELRDTAKRDGGGASSGNEAADATDRVAVAVLQTGAAISERLEELVIKLDQIHSILRGDVPPTVDLLEK